MADETSRDLEAIRSSIRTARRMLENDRDDDAYCVVPNRVLKRLMDAFDRLDEGMLTAQLQVPHEWTAGCPWAPGGEVYDGSECPQHKRVHSVS